MAVTTRLDSWRATSSTTSITEPSLTITSIPTESRIYDPAPTILHIFGIPIPEDTDGRVLKKIFKEDSTLGQMQTVYQESREKVKVRGKIKGIKTTEKI